MNGINRREFIQYAGVLSAMGITGCATTGGSSSGPRLVVVGGGFGGATCAKYLRRLVGPNASITLVEMNKEYFACPFSNTVLAGLRTMDGIKFDYATVGKKYNYNVVHDVVTAIDPAAGKITLQGGASIPYDRLVLSPGIHFNWSAIEGYDKAASEVMPHAWKAGPQTALMRKQLEAMPDGGVVIIVAPADPFRCPPGPYERASLIAHYLKANKPKSKILLMDQKDKFSKQALFQDAWDSLYKGMIEWMPVTQGGKVTRVDAKAMAVYSDNSEHKGDVINVIPPHTAGEIAHTAKLVNDKGFCPVDHRTFESTLQKNIHVIGDSCVGGKMPKSAYAAHSQAKVCAAQIAAALSGQPPIDPSWINTCYSLVAPDYGISIAAVYRATAESIEPVEGAGGVSPREAPPSIRQMEAVYADGWFKSVTADAFT
jgi:sulfide dehydrogenase [flavocytochrome c] flavoprotein subunit